MEEGIRRQHLANARHLLGRIPKDLFFELPGRPTVVFQVKDYTDDKALGRASARADVPFLFRAFESGQAPPPRPGTKKAELPRASTIHEYLDWTVTSAVGEEVDELDFGGFRVVALLPRFRPGWPPPGTYDKPVPRKWTALGAPLDPLPQLLTAGKPICAATIRVGLGYLEVPFFATADGKRNRGYGRALLEAIEDIARCLGLPVLLLCSTDDPVTKATWLRLGFSFSTEEGLAALGVGARDLLHMDNTVQMHKAVPQPRPWKSVVLRHQWWRQRLYYLDAANLATPPPSSVSGLPPPSKTPPLLPASAAGVAAADAAAHPAAVVPLPAGLLSAAILPAAAAVAAAATPAAVAPAAAAAAAVEPSLASAAGIPASAAAPALPNSLAGSGNVMPRGGQASSLQGGAAEPLLPPPFGQVGAGVQEQNGSSAAAAHLLDPCAVNLPNGGGGNMGGGSRSGDGRATGGGFDGGISGVNGAAPGAHQPGFEAAVGISETGKAALDPAGGMAREVVNGAVPMEH